MIVGLQLPIRYVVHITLSRILHCLFHRVEIDIQADAERERCVDVGLVEDLEKKTLKRGADQLTDAGDSPDVESGRTVALEMLRLVMCDADVTLQGIDEFEYRAETLALDPVAFEEHEREWIQRMGPVLRLCCHDPAE